MTTGAWRRIGHGLLAGLTGCLSPTWGVLPGDGWTAVDPHAPLLLDAGTALDDAPALAPGIALHRDDGPSIPFTLRLDPDVRAHLVLHPDQSLEPDAAYVLTLEDVDPGGPHAASPGTRPLPDGRIVRFQTGSAPVLLDGAHCAAGAADVVLLTSEPDPTPPVLLVDGVARPDTPVPDLIAPRLWRTALDLLPDGELTATWRGGPALSLPCDPNRAAALVDAAHGRARLE